MTENKVDAPLWSLCMADFISMALGRIPEEEQSQYEDLSREQQDLVCSRMASFYYDDLRDKFHIHDWNFEVDAHLDNALYFTETLRRLIKDVGQDTTLTTVVEGLEEIKELCYELDVGYESIIKAIDIVIAKAEKQQGGDR